MTTTATATIHEDDERFTLQIELRDDHAITLVYWKNGVDKPSVGVWWGNGEHDFGDEPLEGQYGFREWAERAVGVPRGKTTAELSILAILDKSDAGLPLTPAEEGSTTVSPRP